MLVSALAVGALVAGSTSALAVAPAADSADDGAGAGGMAHGLVDETVRGPAALRDLGARGLQRAAQANDVSAARLTELLEDRSTRLAPNGRVFYVDPLAAHAETDGADPTHDHAEGEESTETSPTSAPAYALDQTFALHSRPGSSRTIFLDFDGATVSDTWWNSYGDLKDATHAAFSLDSDRRSFNTTERQLVQEVWARVAEDFAPFDVDVTTEDPGPGALSRTSSSDQTYGTHVLFAPGRSVADALCGGGCSGVAWVGVFNQATGSSSTGPAWVFPDLTNRAGWRLAEVASHEAGHTLGLHHDGTTTASYFTGRSPWGPIMGSSRYGLSQWSIGDYSGANNTQDDLSVISEYGATALADDHGGAVSDGATPVAAGAATGGLIGNAADRDVFRLDHGACAVTARVTTASPGPNLDARLRVLDATGKVLAADNPAASETSTGVVTGTGASVALPQRPAGTLYLEVDGVGQGAMPSSGYSDYGSVGRYKLAVSECQDGSGTGSGADTDTGTDTDPDTGTGTSTGDPTSTGTGTTVNRELTVTPPSRARIGRSRPGARGGKVTARATWWAPLSDGGAPVTGYRVTALKLKGGRVVRRKSWLRPAHSRAFNARLTRGYHRFRVVALNTEGAGAASALSNRVRAR